MSDKVDELCNVIRTKDYVALRKLLEQTGISTDINKRSRGGRTALYQACWSNDVTAASSLLRVPGIDVNLTCDTRHETPIEHSTRYSYVEMVKLLLSNQKVKLKQGLER